MSKYTDFVRVQMSKLRGEAMSSADKMKLIGAQWRKQKGGTTMHMKGGGRGGRKQMKGGSASAKKTRQKKLDMRMHGGGAVKKRRRKQIGSAVPGGFGQYGGSALATSLLPANEVPMTGGSIMGVAAGIGTAISLGQAIAPYAERAVKKLSEMHKKRHRK